MEQITDNTILQGLSASFKKHSVDILKGNYKPFINDNFASFTVIKEDNGTIILTLKYKKDLKKQIPASHKNVDIFFLPKGQILGAHYHENATAKIHVLQGEGIAKIGDKKESFKTGDNFIFPAKTIHDVSANDIGDVVFISFQDNPIIQADGSFDYHPV